MKKFAFALVLIYAVSCVKPDVAHLPGETRLVIDADIASSQASKAIIEGTSFDTGNTIGLFVYHSETAEDGNPQEMTEFVPYGPKYRNIRANYSALSASKPWRFMFEGTVSWFDEMYLIKPSVEVFETGVAVVAYAPWIEGVQSITDISFTLGGKSEMMNDLMWARQNTHDRDINPVDAGNNYKIIPDGNAKSAKLTFRHALSLLKIGFRCKYDDSIMMISSVTIRKKDGAATPLWTSGRFNAMDGGVYDTVESSSVTYDFTDSPYLFQKDYLYVPMLICPQEYLADGDYVFEFCFNGQEIASEYEIRKSDVGGGFKAGMVYTFSFTVDNFIQFDNVEVSEDWEELDENKAELRF